MGFKGFIEEEEEEEEEEAEAAGTDPGEGQRGLGPPLGPKFFFLVCKIFQKKLGPPWFLVQAPLTPTIPSPGS